MKLGKLVNDDSNSNTNTINVKNSAIKGHGNNTDSY